jgi:hypothetical protein
MSIVALAVEAGGQSSLPAAVYRTVAVTADGRIYVLGGHDVAGGSVTAVEAFDPATGAARRAGDLVYQTHGAAAANLEGRILVFGGASTAVHDVVQQFLPSTGRSRVVGSMPTVRADLTAAVVGRRAILVGGFDGVSPQPEPARRHQMFTPRQPARDENPGPMTPAASNGAPRDDLPDQMRADLTALLGEATAGELSSAGFRDRLAQIHTRYLGDNADTAANRTRRSKALRAFERLRREAPSRHHELELIADALGIQPE